jgi:hypothetical protein
VPVVAVNDVGCKSEALARLQCRSLQDQEAQMLVGVGGVDRRTIVGRGAMHEKDRHGRAGSAGFQKREPVSMCAEAQLHVLHVVHGARVQSRHANAGIQRHEDAHVVPLPVQVTRQRGGDVGQAAGFSEWIELGGDEADA